jgi:hypothetical protein
MAEKPKPEFPMPVAVTRHLETFLTFAQAVGRFALLHLGQHVVLSLPMTWEGFVSSRRGFSRQG